MPYSIKYFDNFSGGENTKNAAEHLRPTQLRHCVNADLIESGGYKTRTGIEEHTAYLTGVVWQEVRPVGDVDRYWSGAALDGQYAICGTFIADGNGRLYTSVDYGVTWTERQPEGNVDVAWFAFAISGGHMYASESSNGKTWVSDDYGVTWTELLISAASFGTQAISASGAYVILTTATPVDAVYISNDYGVTFTKVQPNGTSDITYEEVGIDDKYAIICDKSTTGRVYISSDYGATWAETQPIDTAVHDWTTCAISEAVAFVTETGGVYRSADYGATWAKIQPDGSTDTAYTVRIDGQACAAVTNTVIDTIYRSNDYGVSWVIDTTGASISTGFDDIAISGKYAIASLINTPSRLYQMSGGGADLRTLIEYEYIDTSDVRQLEKYALYNGDLVNADDATDILVSGFGEYLAWEVYYNKLYLLGSGIFKVYDGSAGTVADVTSTTSGVTYTALKRCKYLEQRGDRMFAAGDHENPNFLYYCPPLDPTEWDPSGTVTGTGTINSITDDGDIITGLKEFQGNLVVMKRRTAFAWTGYDPSSDVYFKQLPVHEGCISEETMVIIDDMLVYMGENGVYALLSTSSDTIATRVLSDNIQARMFDTQHNVIYPHLDTSCAVFYKDRYMVSCKKDSDSTFNDIVFVFYPYAKTWTAVPGDQYAMDAPWSVYEGWYINSFLASLDGELYSASSTYGRIHLHNDNYNDMGVAIHMDVIHRQEAYDDKVRLKKWKRMYIFFKQMSTGVSTMSVSAIVDGEEFLDTIYGEEMSGDITLVWNDDDWDSSNWSGAQGVEDFGSRYAYINARGNRLSFRVQTDVIDTAVMIYGIAAEYKIKKPARRA